MSAICRLKEIVKRCRLVEIRNPYTARSVYMRSYDVTFDDKDEIMRLDGCGAFKYFDYSFLENGVFDYFSFSVDSGVENKPIVFSFMMDYLFPWKEITLNKPNLVCLTK